MRKSWKQAVSVIALVICAVGAAQAEDGWHGRADAGYSVDGQIEVDTGDDLDFDNNWMAAAGIGYGLDNGFRVEGELSYRDNDFSDFDGDAQAIGLMANLF
jgi:opacity protein-like surface antigen